jgi:hypothetical protein
MASYKKIKEIKTLLKIKPPKKAITRLDEPVSRDSYWKMHDGTLVKIRHIFDDHLLNLIAFLRSRMKHRGIPLSESPMFSILKKEVELRGLDMSLAKRPRPFLDEDGVLKIWDHESQKIVVYKEPKNK